MDSFKNGDETYELDADGFLLKAKQWDKEFPAAMASEAGIEQGLTRDHWNVIDFIREIFKETGKCPLVYETCRMVGIRLQDLELLFPAGYLRGACRLAGVTYREGTVDLTHWPLPDPDGSAPIGKTYAVDVRGFLVDSDQWDEYYAMHRAYEMKLSGGMLTDKHWGIIRFVRRWYADTGNVPTVYDTCERYGIELDELERLFPDGYHRGVIKLAGLRVK